MNEEKGLPYTHLILMAQDEIGQLRSVLDAPLRSVSISRKPDGTGHIYAEFTPQVSREGVEKMLEAQKAEEEGKTPEMVAEMVEETKVKAKAAKSNGKKKPKAAGKSKESSAQV